jgi:CRISPR-associated protein Cmr1
MANRGTVPSAPSYEELPPPHNRASRAGPLRSEFTVCLKTITPVLGGAVTPRTVDEIDVIRSASVRGHLRFWWRALYGHQYATASELFAAESALWGRAADEKGGRSAVELGIRVHSRSQVDSSNVRLGDTGAYALWPARETRADGAIKDPAAPRWKPGLVFALSVLAPRDKEREVKNAIRAWVLFGGYGGQTRRGYGSLTVKGAAEEWLPSAASREAVAAIFGRDVFAREQARSTFPWLAGASLRPSKPDPDAIKAWKTARGWLRDFRQGTPEVNGRPRDGTKQPLIVKAMPLANGTFAPIALWLNRKMP